VVDVMEGARAEGYAAALTGRGTGAGGRSAGKGSTRAGKAPGTAQAAPGVAEAGVLALGPEQALRRIKQLEAEMFKHARNLEFEQAARLRDEVERLKRAGLGLPGTRAG